MTGPKTRAKRRATSEDEAATPSAIVTKKTRKRTPEKQASTAEAQRQNEANHDAKMKKTHKDQKTEEQKAEEQRVALQEISNNKKKSGSPEKATIVRARCLESVRRRPPPSLCRRRRHQSTARNLKTEFRNAYECVDAFLNTDRTSPPNLRAASEQRVGLKGTLDATNASAKEELAKPVHIPYSNHPHRVPSRVRQEHGCKQRERCEEYRSRE